MKLTTILTTLVCAASISAQNWVSSATWAPSAYGSLDTESASIEPGTPAALHTTDGGDHVLQFAVTTIDGGTVWNGGGIQHDTTFGFPANDTLYIHYKSDQSMSLMVKDVNNGTYLTSLPASVNYTLKKITRSQFGPNWQNPPNFDWSQLTTLVFDIGVQNPAAVHDVTIKQVEFIASTGPVVVADPLNWIHSVKWYPSAYGGSSIDPTTGGNLHSSDNGISAMIFTVSLIDAGTTWNGGGPSMDTAYAFAMNDTLSITYKAQYATSLIIEDGATGKFIHNLPVAATESTVKLTRDDFEAAYGAPTTIDWDNLEVMSLDIGNSGVAGSFQVILQEIKFLGGDVTTSIKSTTLLNQTIQISATSVEATLAQAEALNVSVYSLQGQLLAQASSASATSHQVNFTQALQMGTYVVQVSSDKGTFKASRTVLVGD